MKYANVGQSGLTVSRLGLGMMSYGNTSRRQWHLGPEEAAPIVREAYEAGITLFDTADMYDRGASEEVTGALLREHFPTRDDYVLCTKVYYPMGDAPNRGGLSRKHILSAVDASLQRLGTNYIDIYQIHRWDPHTPIEETMQALDDIVRSGKARYIGASSMFAWQLSKAHYTARLAGSTTFISMQNQYNLVYREEEREMLPLCQDLGLGVLVYSPLARGLLSGTRTSNRQPSTVRSGNDPLADKSYAAEDHTVVDALRRVASARGARPSQVALAWLWQRPQITAPLLGATKIRHLREALSAMEIELDQTEIATLEEPYRPHAVIGHQ